MSKTGRHKLVYCSIGLILTFWINVAMSIHGSEATFIPFILIILLGMPISLMANFLGNYLLSNISEIYLSAPIIGTNMFVLCILLSGYWQWFHFVPWIAKKLSQPDRSG